MVNCRAVVSAEMRSWQCRMWHWACLSANTILSARYGNLLICKQNILIVVLYSVRYLQYTVCYAQVYVTVCRVGCLRYHLWGNQQRRPSVKCLVLVFTVCPVSIQKHVNWPTNLEDFFSIAL